MNLNELINSAVRDLLIQEPTAPVVGQAIKWASFKAKEDLEETLIDIEERLTKLEAKHFPAL
jgi:hypothetical protein